MTSPVSPSKESEFHSEGKEACGRIVLEFLNSRAAATGRGMGGWRDKVSSRTCYCGVYLIDLEPRAVLSLEMIAAGSAVTLLSVRLADSEYYIMSFESGTRKLTDAKSESAWGWAAVAP